MNKDSVDQKVLIYERKDGAHFEVTLQDETVWLTQTQIANLFVVRKPAISKHINNICKEGELERKSTVSKMETVQREGGRFITRKIEYYNLDMIIAVGYRVSSRHATRFRVWATKILKEHIIRGYTVNEQRLMQEHTVKVKELQHTIVLLQNALRSNKP